MQISTRTTNTIVLVTFLLVGLTQSAILREKADRWRDDDERWAEEMNLVEPPPNPMLLLNHFETPTEKVAPKVGLRTLIKALYQLNAFDDRAAMKDQNDAEIEQLQSENSPKTHFNENLPSNPEEIMEEPESQSSPSSRSQFVENSPINTEETVVSIELSPPEKSEISSSSDNNSSFNTEVPQLTVEMSPTKENDSSSEESTPRSLSILLEDLVDTVHLPTHVESDRTEKFTHSFRYGYGTPFHPRGV